MSRFHQHEWDLLPEKAFRPRGWKGSMTLEGGKGSDAPAPDPELIRAQIKSLGIQDSAIQAILANSDAMRPLQMEQMRFGLDSSKAAFAQANQDRDWTIGRRDKLSVVQDGLIEEANTFDAEARRNELAAQATADVSKAFDAQRDQTTRQMSRMGVNPNSGKFAAMDNQNSMAEAAAKAGAAGTARTVARNEGRSLKTNAANMLAGYPGMGMQATGAAAGYGASGLNIANTGLAGINSGIGAGAGLAGQMGSNATGMFNAQANYKLQSDAAANANDPFATLLGAGTQLGVASILKSDRRLKEDIFEVGMDERTGLKLYEFAYIGGSGRRYEGVMADEVELVMPEAVFEMPDGYKAVNYQMLGIEMKEVQP